MDDRRWIRFYLARQLMVTDCHIHIQPLEMFKPEALALLKEKQPNFDQIADFCESPTSFLKYLDAAGIDRAVEPVDRR